MSDPTIRTRVVRETRIRARVQSGIDKPRIRVRVLPSLLPKEATIEVGTVTTLAPGEDATVVNVGTPIDVVFNFGIPAGEPGADGEAGGRTVLVADTTYHAIDYPSPMGVGGGTGTGTALDPFVGPQYALDWLQKNIDTAGFDVRLEIDSDIATENAPDGYNALQPDYIPLLGGGELTIAFTGGSKITCATSGNGILSVAPFITVENFDADGIDDSVYFTHVIANQAEIDLVGATRFGKAGLSQHQYVPGELGIGSFGTVEVYGGAASHGTAVAAGTIASAADYTLTGAPAFTDDFVDGDMNAKLIFIGTFTGSATGVLYAGLRGTSITSINTLPGASPGTLDATSSYNGVFGAGGGSGTVDSVVAGSGIDVDATDPANPIVAVEANLQAWNALATSAKLDSTAVDTDGTLAANSDAKVASQKATKTFVAASISALSTVYQAISTALTQIAGLSPSNDDFLQRKAGAWANRTVAQVKTDLGLSGSNSGDQTITLTGDVTGSGTGSIAATIANAAVTLAKMANMATGSLIYRKTAGTGAPEVNTLATLKTDLALAKADISGLGTGDSPQFTGIELGAATDTTISRVSAGKIAVEGVNVVTTSSTDTLTNKTIDSANVTTTLLPTTDDGAPLGSTSKRFSDLFLASGAVINFAAGDVVITHSTDTLAFTGAANGYTFDSFFSVTRPNTPVALVNTLDSATSVIASYKGIRATPTNNDDLIQQFFLQNSAAATKEFGRISVRAETVTAASETGQIRFMVMQGGTLTNKAVLATTTWAPGTSDGAALGTTGLQWSDLFLASGGVINWNNGDVTLTHSTDMLTLGGGSFSRGAPVTKTADFTVGTAENWLINNKSGSTCTVTMPAASSFSGRELYFQNYQAQTVVSAGSNIVPLGGGAAGTALLASGAGKWATLVSDGTNWIVMAAG